MSTPKTPGQINCEKYMQDCGFSISRAEEDWKLSSEREKRRWEVAARAVIDAQPCQHPWDLVQKTVNVDGCMGWLSKSITAKCTKCGKEL